MNQNEIKEIFLKDTANHTMDIEMDNGLYRHLKFTNNGSQVYRFDIHTWPGYLTICGDMGTYVFSRIPDMFEFFRHDKLKINTGYWAEKLQAVDSNNARSRDGNGYEEFSADVFEEHVKEEYDNFCEQYMDDDEEVTEAYPEDTQSRKQQLDELWLELREDVIPKADDGAFPAYEAAMNFRWKSDDETLKFDMQDFWEHSSTEYTFHYIWILYAIVWGIQQYDKAKTVPDNFEPGVELHTS
jgi:hypothetical protein